MYSVPIGMPSDPSGLGMHAVTGGWTSWSRHEMSAAPPCSHWQIGQDGSMRRLFGPAAAGVDQAQHPVGRTPDGHPIPHFFRCAAKPRLGASADRAPKLGDKRTLHTGDNTQGIIGNNAGRPVYVHCGVLPREQIDAHRT